MERALRAVMLGLLDTAEMAGRTLFGHRDGACRFEPSCSRYAREALFEFPPHVAVCKIAWRVLRCHPLSRGGYDPVHHTNATRRISV